MKEGFKLGFGITVGSIVGYACVSTAATYIMKRIAKDKDFMEYEAKKNPELYEKLKKYV